MTQHKPLGQPQKGRAQWHNGYMPASRTEGERLRRSISSSPRVSIDASTPDACESARVVCIPCYMHELKRLWDAPGIATILTKALRRTAEHSKELQQAAAHSTAMHADMARRRRTAWTRQREFSMWRCGGVAMRGAGAKERVPRVRKKGCTFGTRVSKVYSAEFTCGIRYV